jgi:hypothetical protein
LVLVAGSGSTRCFPRSLSVPSCCSRSSVNLRNLYLPLVLP